MCRCRALMDELDDDSLTAIEVQRMLLLADREAQQEHAVLRQAPQARLTEGGRGTRSFLFCIFFCFSMVVL